MTAGVYLIRADNGLTKIGYSSNVENRLMLLQTGAPLALTLVHVIETDRYKETERYLHRQFTNQRRRGEWFALSEDDIIAAKASHFPPPQPTPAVPAPPASTLTASEQVTALRFGRALKSAYTQIDRARAEGQPDKASRWEMIAERLWESAVAFAKHGERWERIAASTAAGEGV